MFSPSIWFAIALAFLSCIVFFPAKSAMRSHMPRHPQAKEPHHFWLGVAIFVVGYALGQAWLVWLGALVMFDDAGQHFFHWMACLYWEHGVPPYGWQLRWWLVESPIHRLAGAVGLYRLFGLEGR